MGGTFHSPPSSCAVLCSYVWVRIRFGWVLGSQLSLTNPRAPIEVRLQRGWPRVELQDEIFPENFLRILMVGNMEKAQPRLRQRPSNRLRRRRDTEPRTCNVEKWKNADRWKSADGSGRTWVENPWSTRLPVRSCFSRVCTPQKQNPSDPELQPIRNAHGVPAHTDSERNGQTWRAADIILGTKRAKGAGGSGCADPWERP